MPPAAAQKLPEDFNGIFYFTNYTDTDFVDKWDSVEYTFPAGKTVPLIIPNETPLGIQDIRKKFAKNLAIKVFYDTEKYKIRESDSPVGSGKVPAIFTDSDIAPYIQRCLEPLPLDRAKAILTEADNTEKKLRTDENGRRRTRALKGDENLVPEGTLVA